MQFIITEASACNVDLGTYNSTYIDDKYVHLECKAR